MSGPSPVVVVGAIVLVTVLAVVLGVFSGGLLAFDNVKAHEICRDCVDWDRKGYGYGVFDSYFTKRDVENGYWVGGSGTDNIDCLVDLPNYKEFVVGEWYLQHTLEPGRCVDYPDMRRCYEWELDNARGSSGVVYGTNVANDVWYAKPRQHPDCVAVIKEFADSAGVNLTVEKEVVVVQNQTIYACPTVSGDYDFSLDACEGGVVYKPVGGSWWDSVVEWWRNLW